VISAIDRRAIPLAFVIALAMTLGGCNYIGAAGVILAGPPKVPALTELPKERPLVIFIDDPSNRMRSTRLRDAMGGAADRKLLTENIVKDVISSRSARLASRMDTSGPDGAMLSIVEIGRAVEADTVVWVVIDDFSLTTDGVGFTPSVTMRLKVMDTRSGDRLWPGVDQPAGARVTIAMPQGQGVTPSSRPEQMRAEQALAEYAGIGLAQLFYSHEKVFSHVAP